MNNATISKEKLWLDVFCQVMKKGYRVLAILLAGSLPFCTLMAHGSLHEAIERKSQKIETNPDDAMLLFERGMLYQEHGEIGRALEDFHKVLRIEEAYYICHLPLSQLYLKKARPRKALFHISYFLESEPANPFAFETRASVYQLMGQHALAVSDLRNMIALKNDNAIRPEDYFQLSDGILKAHPGNYDEAIAALREGIQRLGNIIALQSRIIALQIKSNRCAEALEQIDQAMAPLARKEQWLAKKAQILEMNGQPQEAYAVYQQARTVGRAPSTPGNPRLAASHAVGQPGQSPHPPFARALPGVIRGPYLQMGTPTSMTIKWRTETSTDSKIWYGASASSLTQTLTIDGTRTDHEVTITGLTPNTRFYYAVGHTGGILAGGTGQYYFRTSPNTGDVQPVRAWVLGDCGTANDNARAVRDGYYSYASHNDPNLILLLGDNAYDDGSDSQYQDAIFENMYEDQLIHSVLWSTPGNHDYYSASAATQTGPYFDIFSFPKNGEAGGLASGTEAYYSFDYANIHFVVLDSHDSGRKPGDPMLIWLENDLNATVQDWTIVFFHHPPYSKGSHDSDIREEMIDMRENILPILEAAGVDLVLSGHSHSYERSYLIQGHYGYANTFQPSMILDDGNGRVDGNGAYQKEEIGPNAEAGSVYVVAGSSGKVSDGTPLNHPVMYYNAHALGSLSLEVNDKRLDLKFIGTDGNVSDYFTIQKYVPFGNPPFVSITSPPNGAFFAAPQTLSLEAQASDSDGAVDEVTFFVDGDSVGVDYTAPYSVDWTPPGFGIYTVKARAIDNNGNPFNSAVFTFQVGELQVCSQISEDSGDAEERSAGQVNLSSADLELVDETNQDNQTVGLRFSNHGIPQGAVISSAYIQFTADETRNDNPCNLTIFGDASDDAAPFSSNTFDITNRSRTTASVAWAPSDWLAVGDAGPAQQTPDLASIIQEIVNRPAYTANSAIALIIEGEGARTAKAHDGSSSLAPEICIEYHPTPPAYDCPLYSANIGAPCYDGDYTTVNDTIDINCNCIGTPTPCTGIGDNDADGVCSDVDCDDSNPNISYPGDACNDGDNTTINDTIDVNCNCVGTPTACTGIGDADGDGACSDVDCDDNDPNLTTPGVACNDGDNTTINDILDMNCNCAGTPTACTGIGDNDGDGVCSDVDCDDNDPSNTGQPGIACDDGDNTTINDTIDGDCNCAGAPTACTGIGDNDGDGICADVDCDDNDPNITTQPGDLCDDGDPGTIGDSVMQNCRCNGVPVVNLICASVDSDNDDAEEGSSGSVSTSSSDLELINDSDNQTVGLRFDGLNIPQGSTILNAYVQFTVDEATNDNPCNLKIYGQASDDASAFSESNGDITSRPKTSDAITWSPPDWLTVGDAGAAQQTPDLSSIIQEIINRNGYTSSSSIGIIIHGTGRRTAVAFDGAPANAPEICIEYSIPIPDCPALLANIGDPCDDGDNTTLNDKVDANCNCAGTPTACTGIGDADGDGICADADCNDYDPNNTNQPGDACDDGDNTTLNDTIDGNCNCTGAPTACTGIGDNDGDGVCADVDCDDNDPNISQPGEACDDGDNTTFNDIFDANCNCAGTPTPCSGIGDADNDGICADVDCDDNDPGNTSQVGDACDDGDNTTLNDTIDANCNCTGAPTACTGIGDADNDGICADVDCDDNDPSNTNQPGDACDDGDNTTINDLLDTNCNCTGTPTACTGIGDADNDGICADVDCDDNNPNITTQIGDACDDGDNTTLNDVLDANCNCAGTPTACTGIGDADNDGICTDVDCDDNDPNNTNQPGDTCDDGDNTTLNDMLDANCNCAGTPTACTGIGDADNDGICADVDCDDNDPNITAQVGDICDDGNPDTFGERIQPNCQCGGGITPTTRCSMVANGNDGAEEDGSGRMDVFSSDLELSEDPTQGIQTIGIRFNNLDIPQGAVVTSARIQFTVDETRNINPCNLNIYGQDSDNATTFTGNDFDITSRPRTSNVVAWSPADWTSVGNAGAAQQTPDISNVIQEIINRPGYSSSSSIAIIIDGVGRRTAESFDGAPANAPELCIEYYIPPPDCLVLQADMGDPCDDGDNTTLNDAIDDNCQCTGTPTACTGIGDADGDGICADTDCDDNDPDNTHQPGDACDDGDNTTLNDQLDNNCNCVGTPTACTGIGDADSDGICADTDCNDNDANNTNQIGDACDDGDNTTLDDALDNNCNCIGVPTACTGIGDADGDGICADTDCDDNDPNNTSQVGDACNDGDNTTLNDQLDANCNCAGTPTACTGIGDADNDGVCADVDCDDNDPDNTNQIGDACNDGDNTTIDDRLDNNCNCAGTPTACTGIGDNDGDGICADVDCDDNDPNITAQAGDACNDGDNTTLNDVLDANCNCIGTPTACTGIGDNDGDGICANVDCDDNNPNITTQVGDACDDGNPNTIGETIQLDCSCSGGVGPITTCSRVGSSNDDAEQQNSGITDLNSSDLELVEDPSQGAQTVGMRFNNLDIPQGATIIQAYLQFTADETRNVNPCNLNVYGQASDNASTFTGDDFDITGRPRTNNTVLWTPANWTSVGSAGAAQQTPDLSVIIQEIVNRSGYTPSSSIAIIIEGAGSRTAESFDGAPASAPELCVEYYMPSPTYDCPALQANIGDACNDGDNTTLNDQLDDNCNCAGTPTTCTGIGDNDGDGVCADVDCDDNDPNITDQVGDACNDGDNTTFNDQIDANCNCTGAPTACTGIGDNDGDGVCADVDCDDNDPNITDQIGDACNDGDNTTFNDQIDANCNCTGAPTACTGIGDNDGDGVCADVDCDDNDPNITDQIGDACNDGDNTTFNDQIDANCNCAGAPTACTGIGDNDGDGVCADVDCDDNDPDNTSQVGDACNDGDNTTFNDQLDANCNCAGTPTACTGIGDNDGDGVCADVDCDDNDPDNTSQVGDACNDGDNTTFNDQLDANCNCAGTPTACTGIGDADGDGVCADVDCDDNDPNNTSQVGDACNDGDNTTFNDQLDANCNCAGTPTACTGIGDNDGDGVCADVDCDDNDPDNTSQVGDACNDGDNTTFNDQLDANCNCAGTPTACTGIGDNDGDGVCADVDCDDNDPDNTSQVGDACDDGDNTTFNDQLDANCNCAGTPTACTGIGDADGDGVCADVDCDDNDPNIITQAGDACDDGNPNTFGETIQTDCSCAGGMSLSMACSSVNSSSDDAEEQNSGTVEINSSDLEMANDPSQGIQTVGMRFTGLNIPQGATISSAYIQFMVDEVRNENPCNLTIYGQATDNAPTFSTSDFDITGRPRTSNSIAWMPADWATVGAAGAAEQTPDLSAILQEVVNRNGYTSGSSVVIIIEGIGRRTAEAFDGNPSGAPELCVEYFIPAPTYDCPAQQANIGDACDDGDNTTLNDIIDGNCNCTGTPTACYSIGDADGDGICADVDCDDNDPNIASQPGESCDDGNPQTINETIQADCSCGGGIPLSTTCSRVNTSSDDAEENSSGTIDLSSSDIELINDPNEGDQTVGLRFTGLNIPQGATVTSAHIQFTADETRNVNPSSLTIYGQASDNSSTFSNASFDISSRPRTSATVNWTPPDWGSIGSAGAAQLTTDISSIIQEIVNRDGYSLNSSIAIIIDGAGNRTAEAFDAFPDMAPNLCVQYYIPLPEYDCPAFDANIGDACNDDDNTTLNDQLDDNCNCAGTPTACTGIGDADGDGVCADVDCDDNDPNITGQVGDACNDGDNTTLNDQLDDNCNCAGTPTACTGIGDADGDGVCADVDCDDNDPNITGQVGDACNDGDNTTLNDQLDANCNCAGTPTACTGIGDADGDGVCADVDCDDNDPNITGQVGDACNDGDNTTLNDQIDDNCNCAGTPTACTGIGDADGDGVCADVDCDDNDPNITGQVGDACNDGDNTTLNDQIDDNCNCAGTPTACTGIGDADGDGVCADVDCDDNDPNITGQVGDACNDGDNTTFNDQIDDNCNCAGTPTACTGIGDNDGDGVCADVDCDDNDPNITGQVGDACNDGDNTTFNDQIDDNCNCAGTPTACTGIGDNDGDGVCADVDCDDNDPNITGQVGDACNDGDNTTFNDQIDDNCNCAGTPTACTGIGDNDGDGVCADVDCDDNDPNITGQVGDACNDGDNTTLNDQIDANCNCAGTPTACTGIGDNDGDGVCADVDCDDNDPNITGQVGDACNDGDNTTLNDQLDANCNCAGTPTACTGIGDNDGDGVCADVDCDDNDPNITGQVGDACNDGDNTTLNDQLDANCNCAGTPTACTGIGDADGDGVCADVDCDDNDPNITGQVGDACNDGDPNTFGETIQSDCSCSGGMPIHLSCSKISSSSDDGEERVFGTVNLASGDLDMVSDSRNVAQTIGMRFNNLNIPQGSLISSAYIQFTADETANINPCDINIYGEASDNSDTFSDTDFAISSRPRTNATVGWTPVDWLNVNDAGAAQQTPNLSSIIQEIVNRSGFSSGSSITIIIDGVGRRTADAFDSSPAKAPELCIEYAPVASASRWAQPTDKGEGKTGSTGATTGVDGKNAPPSGAGMLSPLTIHPNPAHQRIMVSFSSTVEGQAQVQIRSLNGGIVFNSLRNVQSGKNTLRLEDLSLPGGMYFLQLYVGQSMQSSKFVIMKQ
ncbi:MAG: metallophosphoesterase [Lewinellaceae bacterium]|nr:metallophosphoesterase [Lewinellaceae bacterium]